MNKALMGWLVTGGAAWTWMRRRRAYSVRGRVVLITGGSRGLGLVLARTFGAAGARLAICARDPEELERAEVDLRARGIEVLSLPGDVGDPDQARQLVEAVRQHYGALDVLLNNAGVIQVGPQEEMTLADYEEAMRVNFYAALHTTLSALPILPRPGGRIVNIASIGGKLAVPHLLPYSASKFALVGFSQGLCAELRKDGLLVTTVCPGLMRTGSPRHASFKGQHEKEYAWFNLGDSLPGVSVSAEYAARRILLACERGEAEVLIGLPAIVAAPLQALLPGLTAEILGLVNRLLPAPGGIGTATATGADSQGVAVPAVLTRLGDEAAARNNEIN